MYKRRAKSLLEINFLKKKLEKYQDLICKMSDLNEDSNISVKSDDEGNIFLRSFAY